MICFETKRIELSVFLHRVRRDGTMGVVLSRLRAKVPKMASGPFSYAIFGTFSLRRYNLQLMMRTGVTGPGP